MPTASIARQVKALRTRQGITAEQLAERMRAVGVPFDKTVLANLETGRRRFVTVQELLALAYVLDVAPVHLVVPTQAGVFQVVPAPRELDDGQADVVDRAEVRRWIAGEQPLPETDLQLYVTQIDEETFRERFGRGSKAGGDSGS